MELFLETLIFVLVDIYTDNTDSSMQTTYNIDDCVFYLLCILFTVYRIRLAWSFSDKCEALFKFFFL